MESYKISPEKQGVKKYIFFWILINIISISFTTILSGTCQYYLPALIPIGLGLYIDVQSCFILIGISVFALVNVLFIYFYFKRSKKGHKRRRR